MSIDTGPDIRDHDWSLAGVRIDSEGRVEFPVPDGIDRDSCRRWCNDLGIGGTAYCTHRGVIAGFDAAGAWVVRFSSDPKAKWNPGTTNPRFPDEKSPWSPTAVLIHYTDLPDEYGVRELALKWYRELTTRMRRRIQQCRMLYQTDTSQDARSFAWKVKVAWIQAVGEERAVGRLF